MRLSPSPEHVELRSSLRAFLAQSSPLSAVRQVVTTDLGYDPEVWRRLTGELGVASLAVDESRGGAGFGITELAVAMEECGAALLPGPLLGSAVLCGLVLDAIEDEDLLPEVVSGEVVAALVNDPAVTVTGYHAFGSASAVLDGSTADRLVVVGADGLYSVDPTGPGVSRRALVTMDQTRRQARVDLVGAPAVRLGPSAGRARSCDGAIGRALDRATVALAAEQLGVMRRSIELTVAYSKERQQFGRPIGSFQAVKHGLADVYTSYELAVGAVAWAAWAADNSPEELPVAASVAKAYLSPQSFEATFQMIQYHGGIGYTWEHDAHLYYKRATTNEVLLGTADDHLERLAAHLLDGSVSAGPA